MDLFNEAKLKPITLTADDAYIIESIKVHSGVRIGGEVLAAVKEILIRERKTLPNPKECSHAYVEYLSSKIIKYEFDLNI